MAEEEVARHGGSHVTALHLVRSQIIVRGIVQGVGFRPFVYSRANNRSLNGRACEILGLDPLYVANEGKLVAIVAPDLAEPLVTRMRQHQYGADACIIGEVKAEPGGIVSMRTGFGGTRIVDMLVGEQLPRIC